MRYLLSTILNIALCQLTIAQHPSKLYTVNKTYEYEELTDLESENTQSFEGQFFGIFHSNNLILNKSLGPILPLEYLPKNKFIVAFSAEQISDIKPAFFNLGFTGTLKEIPAAVKLSKRLYANDIPDWAWLENGQIKIWIRYYKTLHLKNVGAALIEEGYQILESRESENLIAIAYTPGDYTALTDLPFVQYIQEMEDPGEVENYTARTNHRVNTLQSNLPGLPYYDGNGITVGLGDDGEIGPHEDYRGRLTQQAGASNGDHGDHVAGTIFGAGNIDPRGRGMAPGAEIFYQSYPDNLNDADQNYDNRSVRITSSSYSNGCNAGYTNFTRQMDKDAFDNPNMLHVFSAGNSNNTNCGYGAGTQWGNVTGGHKIAKNVIAVANTSFTDNIAGSSSRGPASDGRIKPDVAGVGTNVYSTTNPDLYTTKSGTSMSCPGVSGSLAVLYEAFKDNNAGSEPKSALLKGILMNSCDDVGNDGPDFIYGYGRINVDRAYTIIENASYARDSIANNGSKTFTVNVPSGSSQAKIMLIWSDPQASTAAAYALVNDLDLTLTMPGGNIIEPWILDHTPSTAALSAPATRGRDSINNIEQITLDDPAPGNYTLTVNGSNIPSGEQEFYLIYSFVEDGIKITYPIGGESFSPFSQEVVRLNLSPSTNTMATAFSLDGGATWINSTSGINGRQKFFNFGVPNFATDNAMIRVIRGNDTAYSGVFSILGVTSNIQYSSICPDSLTLTWAPVTGATGYIVYQLGSMYMDSIAFTDTNVATIANNPNISSWVSVAAVINGAVGKRSLAEVKPGGISNCIIPEDLRLDAVLSPADGYLPDCFNLGGTPVKVRVINSGADTIDASVMPFNLSYTFNGGSVVTENVSSGVIPPGDTLIYTFSTPITLVPNITYTTTAAVSLAADGNGFNDSLEVNTLIYSGQSESIAYFENFEDFNNCNVSPDCGATNCTLTNGWVNATNGSFDDVDWRTNSGSTPSSGTGPSADFNPGTLTGKYLYLEASGSCLENEAWLVSPCFDFSNATAPALSFSYHMYGQFMGSLNVDVFDGSEWQLAVIPEISGDQGNSWNQQVVDLSAYSGQTVIVRFRGKTGSDFTSDLALDNIEVYDASTQAPVVAFTASTGTTACEGDTVTFTSQTTGAVSYLWNFGPDAFPSTDTTAGPIQVVFTKSGNMPVSLTAYNQGGSSVQSQNINVKALSIASFSINIQNQTVNFFNQSVGNPTSFFWDFGNGDTSSLPNPSVFYDSLGSYTVTLTAFNECGSQSFTLIVNVNTVSLEDENIAELKVYPNPGKGVYTISGNAYLNNAEVTVNDLTGKLIIISDRIVTGTKQGTFTLDLTKYPNGVYLLQLKNDQINQSIKLIKQ